MLLGVFCCLKCNHKKRLSNCKQIKVLLENGWNCKQMITESEAAIPLETTLHAFRNQEKTKQRSTIVNFVLRLLASVYFLIKRQFCKAILLKPNVLKLPFT